MDTTQTQPIAEVPKTKGPGYYNFPDEKPEPGDMVKLSRRMLPWLAIQHNERGTLQVISSRWLIREHRYVVRVLLTKKGYHDSVFETAAANLVFLFYRMPLPKKQLPLAVKTPGRVRSVREPRPENTKGLKGIYEKYTGYINASVSHARSFMRRLFSRQ